MADSAMMISISKTLLEPLTIPWFYSDTHSGYLYFQIISSLDYFFKIIDEKYEPRGKDPCLIDGKLHLSAMVFLKNLRQTAENRGALKPGAVSEQIINNGKHVGNVYRIGFAVPNDPVRHVWTGVSLFGKL
jgi:hypothetical protein